MKKDLVLSKAAINYSWRQLAVRAGLVPQLPNGTGFEELDLPVYYRNPEKEHHAAPAVYVIPCDQQDRRDLINLPPNSLDLISPQKVFPNIHPYPIQDSIPVILWGKDAKLKNKPFVELQPNGQLVFYADLIMSVFFFLSRLEEIQSPKLDKFQRFQGKEGFSYVQGLHTRPVVDEYALIIKTWLEIMYPSWRPQINKFSVRVTHDVDRLYQFPNIWDACLTLGETLIKKRQPLQFIDGIKLGFNQWSKKPKVVGINRLVEISKQTKQIKPEFFFILGEGDAADYGYDYQNPAMLELIKSLTIKGIGIGLHATQQASLDKARLAVEKHRLENILEYPVDTCRFHYLQFEVPKTWRILEQVGFKYSANMGFADIDGFRCATCQPYQPFDIEHDREMKILEIPLIVMDVTFIDYQKITPQQASEKIKRLAQRCQRVGGVFTLLWHNTSLRSNRLAWGKIYPDIIANLDRLLDDDKTGGNIRSNSNNNLAHK